VERGSERAGAGGRTGTAVGAKGLRQGEPALPSSERSRFSSGVNLSHRTLKDYN